MRKLTFFLTFLLVMLSGCALPFRDSATPEAKATVIAVANNYINSVFAGDERAVAHMVDWPTYLGDGATRITREEYLRQFRNVQQRWSKDTHPFVGLQLADVTVSGDDATVVYNCTNKAMPAEIKQLRTIDVQLLWNGNGWVVRGDSLFGKDHSFSNLAPKQTPANPKS